MDHSRSHASSIAPGSSPATPRKARERIMEAARRLFYTRGINATGIDLVIAEACVAKGSMYHHFGSKQALVIAYLQREETIWHMSSVARDNLEADPTGRLALFFDGISADVIAGTFHGCPFMNAAIERPDDPEIRRVITHYRGELALHIAGLIGANASSSLVLKLMVLYDGAKTSAKMTRDPALVELAAAMACDTVHSRIRTVGSDQPFRNSQKE